MNMQNTVRAVGDYNGFKESGGDGEKRVVMLPIDKILPKTGVRRSERDENGLWELSYSIKLYGVVQPIIVKRLGMGTYELIAGERRMRAARLAGLVRIPALIYENENNNLVMLAIVENVQRASLSLVDEARAYCDIMERFSLSPSALAKKLGKPPYEVESKAEIMKLPEDIITVVEQYGLTLFHARALLKISDAELLRSAAASIVAGGMSAAEAEAYVERLLADTVRPTVKFKLKDAKILTNTLRQIINMLKESDCEDAVRVNDRGIYSEVVLKIPKNML